MKPNTMYASELRLAVGITKTYAPDQGGAKTRVDWNGNTFKLSPCFSFTVCMKLYMPVPLGFGGSHNFRGVVMANVSNCFV